MKHIEVEIRSFISKEEYERFLTFFRANAKFLTEDYQETYYFDCPQDVRIQRNDHFSKIWMKKGKLHDDQREEIEIKCDRGEFEKLEEIFTALGFNVQIKWFRRRFEFFWNDCTVCLDDTRGYGYIIELEKMSLEDEQDKNLELLKKNLSLLKISQTTKEEFHQRFLHYKEHWKELVEEKI